MGQVICFTSFKKRRKSKELAEINRLKSRVQELDRFVHSDAHYLEKEKAVIQGMELKMQLVDLCKQMGITGSVTVNIQG